MTTVEPILLYQAMLSRDRRFDGLFFAAVTTTGVYCRPICPAIKPKFENVVFYPSAAGAETAGFRPCKRCRPDTAPGTPIWSGTSSAVSRALQLIEEGFLDSGDVVQLADCLHMGDRQLRRLFQEHLGASPHAIALTRRLDFARKLIDETTMPMTEIAFASGFESIRRFNDAIKKRFDQNPSELRNHSRTSLPDVPHHHRMTLLLPFRPPLDWTSLLYYLKGREIAGVEVVDIENNRYYRSIRLEHSQGVMMVTPAKKEGHLELTLEIKNTADLMEIVRRVSRQFDLSADPLFINQYLAQDPSLVDIITAYPGLRVPGGWDNYEIAIRTILGQQISIAGANTVTARLVSYCGDQAAPSFQSGITHYFPTPSTIAALTVPQLAKIGMPGKRAETLILLSEKIASKKIQIEGVIHGESVKRSLLDIPGIGPWTVEYISMRALREPDAFPATDLALKRELADLATDLAAPKKMKRPDCWRPWRSYAAIYLWKKYATK
jgi:AraC family transcriptional regulator, regulatory protein of adaptative response / DNA-3-methyladenine glycosylase II